MPAKEPTEELLDLVQAMLDIVNLIRNQQQRFGFSPRSTPTYYPVMVVGGSYPGFLAALMYLVHSDVVDIVYASAAPLLL